MKPYRNDMRFLLPMTMLFVSVFTVAQTSFDRINFTYHLDAKKKD